MQRALIGMLAALAATQMSCNSYELFRIAGYEQQSFSNRADVLFVIDNSDSMRDKSESLAVNFESFIQDFQANEEEIEREDLADAVENYVDYVQNRSGNVDFQFAITTTDVDALGGELVGKPISREDNRIAGRFVEQLLCEATCFPTRDDVESKPNFQCGDPLGNTVNQEYMDCVCGADQWVGNCGSAIEEGIEATFLAMCRAVPNPPTDCFADIDNTEETFTSRLKQNDTESNAGLLRPSANFIPVIVTDEGDNSRRQLNEPTAERYKTLFQQFNARMTWVLIGPGLDDELDVACPGTATDWGVQRYNYLVYTTDGMTVDIFDASCDTGNFGTALEALGELLQNLLTRFPLQSVPDPDTVTVVVDGKKVIRADEIGQDAFGFTIYSEGWTYVPEDNSILFHGAAVPGYDAEVNVYYLPLDGMPRELPF